MNLRSNPDRWEPKLPDASDRWAIAKFGIGQPVLRSEDPKLVRGEGRFTDDVGVAGQAYAVMVRSRNAHGLIRAIDTAAARAMPGVLGVYTGADLAAAGYGTFKCIVPFNNRDGSPMHKPARPALPTDKVRFVGDPVACVVARDPAAGQGCRRGGRGRYRSPPRRHRSGGGGAAGGAAAL